MADARDTVFDALDNAMQGGFFEPDQLLHGLSAADIVIDLRAYYDGAEAFPEEELRPHVEEWLLVNPKARR